MNMDFNFNVVLLQISNDLSREQLESMKFLCRDFIGKNPLEKIDTGHKLFQTLSEKGKLSPENTDLLKKLLTARGVGRDDLVLKLDQYDEGTPEDPVQDETERARLDAAMEVITERLGKEWRKLGRRLDISDVKLESISKKHPSDLEETVVELLKEWRKKQGAQATAKQLIEALRKCNLKLTAEKVEDKLAELGDGQ